MAARQVEIGEMSLAPLEVLRQVLNMPKGIAELSEALRSELVGSTVSGFVPVERLETLVEDARGAICIRAGRPSPRRPDAELRRLILDAIQADSSA